MSKLVVESVSRVFPGVRGGPPTQALRANRSPGRGQRLHLPSSVRRAAASRRCCGSSPALDQPTTGRVLLDGQPVARPGPDRGMVFQSYTLFPWLTVRQNICFGLREKGVPQTEQDRTAAHFIAARRPARLRGALPEDAVRRHAAAHRARARAGQRPEDPAARRAVRRARQPDARADAGAAAGHLGSGPEDRALRDPRHRRGDLHGEPRRGDDGAARAASRRDVRIDLPHPRHYTIKTTPEFSAYKARLTEEIRAESIKTVAMGV